uniref:hypothetical protein n=1 Tax=Parasynechococcus sp. TaxID=3101203 RepID=UPI0037040D4A
SLLAGLALVPLAERSLAQSGLCQSHEAAYNLKAGMRDGLTLKQAKASILNDGYSDGSAACFSAIKHEINQKPYAFPLVHQPCTKEHADSASCKICISVLYNWSR